MLRHFGMSENCERKSLATANLFPLLLINVALQPKSLRNRHSLQTTLSEGRGGEGRGGEGKHSGIFLLFQCRNKDK